AGLVGVRRFVRAGADAVADRMRRLARIAGGRDALADQPVEAGQLGSVPHIGDRLAVDRQQRLEQLDVARLELARAEVLRVVGPVAVAADPDLEQRRLALDHLPRAGRGERLDPGPRPDEREAARERDLPAVAGAGAVHVALPERAGLALLHA